ncbi:MAG: glycosyltransferase [Syntrophobacterales bacterium]|jgi:hyaluronan synthase|nr:glycosyltransferase [Syntrophobacterales bacterium]
MYNDRIDSDNNTQVARTLAQSDETSGPADSPGFNPSISGRFTDRVIYGSILVSLFAISFCGISGGMFQPIVEAAQVSRWSRLVMSISILWALMGTAFLLFRTVLWLIYRPFPSATPANAPSLTVIIPAYNEGAMVKQAINSVLSASYPREKLEVLAIDDGSKDNTWSHIREAASKHPHLVTTVRFPENRGKRAALGEGFRKARGEVVVTVDSDSVIDSNTLLAVAGPFRDPRVGAVAGKVIVLNRDQGIIPKMLKVQFILAFDMLRAVQSTYSTVYCCPGALSAYRSSAVRLVLSRWLNQTFLGVPCTYGEDRSLTNFVLSEGFDTVYQRTARVHTIVPWTYEKLCKMYLRWNRSYIRETIHFWKIIWKRPLWPRAISLIDLLITNIRYPISYLNLALFVTLSINRPTTVINLFSVIGLFSALNMAYYLRSERSWDFLYGILYSYFSFLALFWIFPYAFITVRAKSWMTR